MDFSMELTLKLVLLIWAVWNLITFLLMGLDKLMAKVDGIRISEATLLATAFIMGGVGSFLGSKAFHHKTLKKKFRVGLPLAIVVNVLIVAVVVYFKYFHQAA